MLQKPLAGEGLTQIMAHIIIDIIVIKGPRHTKVQRSSSLSASTRLIELKHTKIKLARKLPKLRVKIHNNNKILAHFNQIYQS